MPDIICVYLVLISYGFGSTFANTIENGRSFTKSDNLTGLVCDAGDFVAETVVQSNLQCAVVCAESTDCVSYFYATGAHTCITCSADLEMSNTDSYPGTIHYGSGVTSTTSTTGSNAISTTGSNPISMTGTSCLNVLTQYPTAQSGVYTLYTPSTDTPVQVYCDMTTEGGGWIVWQRRFDGSLLFNKTFDDYEYGFGDPHGEYWLGLTYLYEFLDALDSDAYLQFGDWNGNISYEWHTNFRLTSGYSIRSINFLSSSYPDTLLNKGFESFDNKLFVAVDYRSNSCIQTHGGGGNWYSNCNGGNPGDIINPNGVYGSQGDTGTMYIYNRSWQQYDALKETKLMTRESG